MCHIFFIIDIRRTFITLLVISTFIGRTSAGKVYAYFVFRLSYLIMAPQPLLSQTLLIFAQKNPSVLL